MTEVVLWNTGGDEGLGEGAGDGEAGVTAEVREEAGEVGDVLELAAVPQAAAPRGSTNSSQIRSFERLSDFMGSIMCPHSNCRFARG